MRDCIVHSLASSTSCWQDVVSISRYNKKQHPDLILGMISLNYQEFYSHVAGLLKLFIKHGAPVDVDEYRSMSGKRM
jgi:hypothetical protein